MDQDTRVTGFIQGLKRGLNEGQGETKIHPMLLFSTMMTDFPIIKTHYGRMIKAWKEWYQLCGLIESRV